MRLTILFIFFSSQLFSQSNISIGYALQLERNVNAINEPAGAFSQKFASYDIALVNQFHLSFNKKNERCYYTIGLTGSFSNNNHITYVNDIVCSSASEPYHYYAYNKSQKYNFSYLGIRSAYGRDYGKGIWTVGLGAILRAEVLTHHRTYQSYWYTETYKDDVLTLTEPLPANFQRYMRKYLLRVGLEAKPRYNFESLPLFLELQTTVGLHLISQGEQFNLNRHKSFNNQLFCELGLSVGYILS